MKEVSSVKKQFRTINNSNYNGQTKCPRCGASNLLYDSNKEKLICNYCNYEFDREFIIDKEKVDSLEGELRGSATKDINNNASNLITIKCDGCGAEITINTKESLKANCHWCGSNLSINKQIDSGIVPDEILPFKLSKEEAFNKMVNYISNKLSFTTRSFKKQLKIENIHGVFFPYLMIDSKAHGKFSGVGEHEIRSYSIDGDTYYDVDVYTVEREFDITVDDLTIESNLERLNKFNTKQKNNIINSIMPFDTENCIKFNANYMVDYTSEKRDIDIDYIENKIHHEIKDIARMKINSTLKKYDRGVRWEKEDINYIGKQWLSAYLPVWLYSYQDKKGVLHYVVVNARTGETVGSVPYNSSKLFCIMGLIMVLSCVIGWLSTYIFFPLLFICLGIGFVSSIIVFIVQDYKYSNLHWLRHSYESETKTKIEYTNNVDNKIDTLKKISNSYTTGANNKKIYGDFIPVDKRNTHNE